MKRFILSFVAVVAAIAMYGVPAYPGWQTKTLSDGSTTNPITIDGESVTATAGDFVQYGSAMFAFNKDGVWQETSLNVAVSNGCLTFS